MTREIQLSQGKVALVDDDDFDRVNAFKWSAVKMQSAPHRREHWYAKRCINYDGKAINVYLHRFILGTPDPIHIDHEDGNGLNCTKSNMRYATQKQNVWNTRVSLTSSTGYKGVRESKNGFNVMIAIDGKRSLIGTFADLEQAARIYDAAAIHVQGEYARTNFAEIDSNAQDIFQRWLAGERFSIGKGKYGAAKLTDDMVRDMRRRYAAGGIFARELAAEYGVCGAAITHALCGRTFGHITDVPPLTADKRNPKNRIVHLTTSQEAA